MAWRGRLRIQRSCVAEFQLYGRRKNMKTTRLLQVNDDGAYEGWDSLGKFVELKTLGKYRKAKNAGYWNRR